jgi:predicted Zn-dependent protease
MNALLESQRGLIAPKDSDLVLWLQTIVDNLAKVSGDDVRDPVRSHPVEKQGPVLELKDDSGEVGLEKIEFRPAIPQRDFDINLICDSTSVNAMCAGSLLVIYDLMLYHMEYDPTKVAVILSHEIAHSIQRHFVEQHGFASLMFMLGDITRGVFWMITEPLGP